MSQVALLALADGSVFRGRSVGVPGLVVGEVVFNTAMTGYQEILSDPSYHQQIVTLTCTHVGNVGTNPEDNESARVFAAGLVVRDFQAQPGNWRSTASLSDYLQRAGMVAIAEIDTRRLTRLLRDGGAQAGCIMAGPNVDVDTALAAARSFPGLVGADLAAVVSTSAPHTWQEGGWRARGEPAPERAASRSRAIVAYDFGVKRNILRLLVDHGCSVTVVPARTTADEVMALQPDGVFLSNGPGDPEPCTYAIEAIRTLLGSGIPVFGICLGHQLLALACGARTVKMKFGHHGANHPVLELATRRVMITSQNHGFCVDEASLPATLQITHRSLFDGTIQGIAHLQAPAFGFQGHPEASPGPHDVRGLFARFVALMDATAQPAGQRDYA